MSATDPPAAPAPAILTSDAKKKKKSRSEKRAAAAKANPHERTKTVVRRLPPNLPEEIFWASVQKWVSDETVVWKSFVQGKLRKKMNKENVHSRAYIAFKTEDLVASFSREYDGHVFRDKAGNEAQAVVEFAPFQKIPVPTEKVKKDHRIGTIEEDEEYQAFLKTLEESTAKTMDTETLLETLIASTISAPQPTSTPLLEALKAEKSAQKDKEAILRNHAHYKEIKKDDKKKGAAAASTSTAAPSAAAPGKDAPATLGKRAAKKAAAAQKAAAAAEKEKGKEKAAPAASGSGAPAKSAPPTPKKKGAAAAATPATADTTAPVETSTAASEPSARRQRPVIAPSSRALEAALSGAGVQKKREARDKGKEKEKVQDGDASDAKGKTRPPTSGKVPVSIAVPSATGGGGVLPAPAILQRDQVPKVLARPTEPAATVPAAEGGAATLVRGGSGGRGGARGGGRGRGRGGPPAQGD
ncbi:hypothetical protein PENSPDRAFT_741883 [Peniophora sp. CONT]|nr:hypothetical protein PENSPDRAFT_741883 [Peniophora sp. CONT]